MNTWVTAWGYAHINTTVKVGKQTDIQQKKFCSSWSCLPTIFLFIRHSQESKYINLPIWDGLNIDRKIVKSNNKFLDTRKFVGA